MMALFALLCPLTFAVAIDNPRPWTLVLALKGSLGVGASYGAFVCAMLATQHESKRPLGLALAGLCCLGVAVTVLLRLLG